MVNEVFSGVRTKMEAGFSRLNDLTILMLTNGFAMHLKHVYNRQSNGVAIGYDGRHNSERFFVIFSHVVFLFLL